MKNIDNYCYFCGASFGNFNFLQSVITNLMKKYLAGACLVLGATLSASNIVPQPAKIKLGNEGFLFRGSELISVPSYSNDSVKKVVDLMIPELCKGAGTKLEIGSDGRIAMRLAANLQPDSYKLSITSDSLIISASRPVGFFYGLQTLRQLLPVASATPTFVNTIEIEDQPRFRWRGFMLDEGRHFFGKEAVKRVIDMMALYKMNRFHWHLTEDQGWRIEIKAYPKLTTVAATRKGAHLGWEKKQTADNYRYGPYFYTQDDIRDIVAYAKERFIEIIPEIDIPGHMQAAIAAYPELLACNPKEKHEVWNQAGVSYDVLNVANPKTIKFATGVMDEITDLFPFGYLHLGGDECPTEKWETNPQCQKRLKELGSSDYRDLQLDFYNQIVKFLKSKGKDRNLIFWNEVLHGNTDLIGKANSDMTIMAWVDWEKAAREAADRGFFTVMCPIIPYYINRKQSIGNDEPFGAGAGTETLRATYQYEPLGEAKEEKANQYIGVQGNFWTEWVESESQLQYLMLPRLAAIAERGWSPVGVKNYDNFRERMRTWHAPYYRSKAWNFGDHELK